MTGPENQVDQSTLAALAANLAARKRLGLDLVLAQPDELTRLVTLARPRKAAGRDGPLPGGGLAEVRGHLGECTRCPLHKTRNNIVFGQGPETAKVMFIGEGPGQQEDVQGRPFVGPAGKLLDRMLAAVGLKRAEVYIANIVKCRPPNNRDPQPGEVEACLPFLRDQIKAISPAALCTLGRPAAQSMLETRAPISALRGNWRDCDGVPLLPTFHPAYLLRQPERKKEAYRDLKALVRRLREV